jgi:hypothetical protein
LFEPPRLCSFTDVDFRADLLRSVTAETISPYEAIYKFLTCPILHCACWLHVISCRSDQTLTSPSCPDVYLLALPSDDVKPFCYDDGAGPKYWTVKRNAFVCLPLYFGLCVCVRERETKDFETDCGGLDSSDPHSRFTLVIVVIRLRSVKPRNYCSIPGRAQKFSFFFPQRPHRL